MPVFIPAGVLMVATQSGAMDTLGTQAPAYTLKGVTNRSSEGECDKPVSGLSGETDSARNTQESTLRITRSNVNSQRT